MPSHLESKFSGMKLIQLIFHLQMETLFTFYLLIRIKSTDLKPLFQNVYIMKQPFYGLFLNFFEIAKPQIQIKQAITYSVSQLCIVIPPLISLTKLKVVFRKLHVSQFKIMRVAEYVIFVCVQISTVVSNENYESAIADSA